MDCAAVSGRENIVQLLIDAEAEVDPRDINNVSHFGWWVWFLLGPPFTDHAPSISMQGRSH